MEGNLTVDPVPVPNQPIPRKPDYLLLFLLLILVIVIVVLAYFVWTLKVQVDNLKQPAEVIKKGVEVQVIQPMLPTVVQGEPSGWRTYASVKDGISFAYPMSVQLVVEPSEYVETGKEGDNIVLPGGAELIKGKPTLAESDGYLRYDGYHIQMSPVKKSTETSLLQYFEKDVSNCLKESGSVTNRKEFQTISGSKVYSYKCIVPLSVIDTSYAFLERPGNPDRVWYWTIDVGGKSKEEDEATVERILSTFQFL